ncbi:fas-binding factor 1 homolog isoform X2 [Brachyhypopomus gauderio]|uniref:fas-binding factor 1 homolog isoform X2 n=1 Tax=Brachyhypopomus gauderio TaxID=698409 RepID=UPI0040418A35
MTSSKKKGLRGSIDDVLGDLLGEDSGDLPVKNKPHAGAVNRTSGVVPSRGGSRPVLDDDFFSKLAEEAEKLDEGSDVSAADPKALVATMKDIDDMDAELFGSKRKPKAASTKPSSAPAQSRTPVPGGLTRGAADPEQEAGTDYLTEPDERKPSSAPAAAVRGYRKFSFMDDTRDDLDHLLDVLDPEQPQNLVSGQTEATPTPEKERIVPKKRDELTFDDDDEDDDMMDAMGFSDSPKDRANVLKTHRESQAPHSTRTRLDEILGIGTSPHLLRRPTTGEKKDSGQPDRPAESPASKSSERPSVEREPERSAERPSRRSSAGKDAAGPGEEDFTFGLYQPSVGSAPEGQQSRRQSVRFSMEDVSSHSPERRPKPSPRPGRPGADWLGLKQDEEEAGQNDVKEPGDGQEGRTHPPSPSYGGGKGLGRTPPPPKDGEEQGVRTSSSSSDRRPGAVASAHEPGKEEEEEEEEDWLAGALRKSKGGGVGRSAERREQPHALGEERDLVGSLHSQRNTGVTPRGRVEDRSAPRRQSSESLGLSGGQQKTTATLGARHAPGTPVEAGPTPRARHPADTQQRSGADTTVPVQQEVLSSTMTPVTADSVQQLLLQQQAQLWGVGSSLELGSVQRRNTQLQPVDVTSLHTTITQLQGQVRSLQMEKDQLQILLDSVQQRHTQDTELMENTHRVRVKLLEESITQREAQVRLEIQGLVERLASSTRRAEQERAELQEQQQRRLAQCQQERDREVQRLRELQRKSILEMKEDYEEQLQRLRKLKDEEIDAVTSATSHTRSLAVVVEQMEQFSSRLGDLACRVENTQESAAHGLELGARHRDQQLRVLQERLSQQQREMVEERTRLKEVIAKMDTQLAEQQRTLQQERWRVTAEQAKAESALRGLEEERRTVTQHITMEREELERAKSSLLEEQHTVMQQCCVERRKLAAEWAQFHAQEKLRQERVEREARHAMERDAHTEGSMISRAQEQAEMTLRAGHLKQEEEALRRGREEVSKLREEVESERARLASAALHLQTRAQEVESFSKLASERYEEGERALQEARQLEAEHQTRLRTIHAEMERLRKQEHSLQQERMRMTNHLKEVGGVKHSLPISPFSLPPAPFTDISPMFASSRLEAPAAAPVVSTSSTRVSPELQATLALLRHTAEKDRDFLQDEQFFLETLKKAPYNSTFHTA